MVQTTQAVAQAKAEAATQEIAEAVEQEIAEAVEQAAVRENRCEGVLPPFSSKF